MDTEAVAEKILLPHHEQQPLCTTRLPYRQGRKLTAVKVYTINDESRHLLVFGVPSLNIRQETKSLFQKFGKLIQFNISPYHEAEKFTETYHLIYEKIQSARVAKRMLDTKNFFGGLLHVCYAPEYETIEETKQKLLQRRKDVLYRIQYLQNEELKKGSQKEVGESTVNNVSIVESNTIVSEPVSYNLAMPSHMIQKSAQIIQPSTSSTKKEISETQYTLKNKRKLNMGEINTIAIGKQIREVVFKPKKRKTDQKLHQIVSMNQFSTMIHSSKGMVEQNHYPVETSDLEVIDATSVNNEILTNVNQQTHEKQRQKEIVIKKIPQKPMNVIKFNIPNKNA